MTTLQDRLTEITRILTSWPEADRLAGVLRVVRAMGEEMVAHLATNGREVDECNAGYDAAVAHIGPMPSDPREHEPPTGIVEDEWGIGWAWGAYARLIAERDEANRERDAAEDVADRERESRKAAERERDARVTRAQAKAWCIEMRDDCCDDVETGNGCMDTPLPEELREALEAEEKPGGLATPPPSPEPPCVKCGCTLAQHAGGWSHEFTSSEPREVEVTDSGDEIPRPYFIEADDTCPKCGVLGWNIMEPDGAASGTTYDNEDNATDMADELNDAFGLGWQAGKTVQSMKAAHHPSLALPHPPMDPAHDCIREGCGVGHRMRSPAKTFTREDVTALLEGLRERAAADMHRRAESMMRLVPVMGHDREVEAQAYYCAEQGIEKIELWPEPKE